MVPQQKGAGINEVAEENGDECMPCGGVEWGGEGYEWDVDALGRRGSRIGLATDAADSGISQGSAERPRERWMWEKVERRPRFGEREEERAEGVTPLTLEVDTGEEVVREVERQMEERGSRERGTEESALIVARLATSQQSVGHPRREEERERREEQWKG